MINLLESCPKIQATLDEVFYEMARGYSSVFGYDPLKCTHCNHEMPFTTTIAVFL